MPPRRAPLLLILAFVVAVFLVDPRGNFPLDDDWGVGFTTFTLLQTGKIEFTPFASATAYLQFIWGAMWASVFGDTFTVLRVATLTLSLGSGLLAYLLLRRFRVRRKLAWFGAATLLFHPLFFWASFTSMTHVPFVFASIVAAWAFVLAWEEEGIWLAVAFTATVASFFTRQFAVLNAIVPLITVLLARRKKLAIPYALALLAFGLLAASGVLVGSQKELALHRPTLANLGLRAVHYIFFNWQSASLFFAAPLLLLFLARNRPRLSRVTLAVCAIVFSLVAWRMTAVVHMPLPYLNSGNVFTDFGLGPPTLRDVFTWRMAHPFALPWGVKVGLTILTTISAAVAASLTIASLRENEYFVRYCALYLLCGTVVAAGMSIHFDRYTIDTAWPLGLLLVLLAHRAQLTRPATITASIVFAAMTIFAIAGTAEYLDWNRSRWQAYAFLRSQGVRLEEMDGGYEINSMLALREGRKDLGKAGVGVIDDRYVLTFRREVPGYELMQAFPYRRWFGLSQGAVHAQRRRS